MSYIDREAAIQAVCKCCLADGNCGHTCREILALKSLPAADVKLVERGKMSNADRIRAMSDSELAVFMAANQGVTAFDGSGQLYHKWLDWLRQEVCNAYNE